MSSSQKILIVFAFKYYIVSEHVSGAGVAEFPLAAQTSFCDSRSHPSQFFSHRLTPPLPLQSFKQQTEDSGPIFIQRIGLKHK